MPILMLKAINFYLGLPVKSVVENKKKYNWCDLSMIFVFILEPKRKQIRAYIHKPLT